MEEEQQGGQVIGAIKIKDGLFIGDEFASKDLEFIISNKVTHIINCSGQQLPNMWESIGVHYLTFPWLENDQQLLFDSGDQNLSMIFSFVEQSVEMGESTLVHSVRGQSRSCCVLAAYLMKKFRWTLYKTLEYLNSRRPDLEIRASFFHQLTALEQKLAKQGEGARSASWQEISDENSQNDSGELLVRNTFLNAKNQPVADIFADPSANYKAMLKDVKPQLRWRDSGLNDRQKLHIQEVPYDMREVDFRNIYKMTVQKKDIIRSALKGSTNKIQKMDDQKDSKRSTSKNGTSNQADNNSFSNSRVRQSSAPSKQQPSQSQTQNPSLNSQIKKPLTPSNLPNRSIPSTNSNNNSNSNRVPPNLKSNRSSKNVLEDGNLQAQASPSPLSGQQQQQQSLQQKQLNGAQELSKPPASSSSVKNQVGVSKNSQVNSNTQFSYQLNAPRVGIIQRSSSASNFDNNNFQNQSNLSNNNNNNNNSNNSNTLNQRVSQLSAKDASITNQNHSNTFNFTSFDRNYPNDQQESIKPSSTSEFSKQRSITTTNASGGFIDSSCFRASSLPRQRQSEISDHSCNTQITNPLLEAESKRPMSASAKEKKNHSFQDYSQNKLTLKNPAPQELEAPKAQTTTSASSDSLIQFGIKKDSLIKSGLATNHHLINPNKPYQRGESPSIKQKEKIQKQHQLKMQQQLLEAQIDTPSKALKQQQQQQQQQMQLMGQKQPLSQQQQQQLQLQQQSPLTFQSPQFINSQKPINPQLPPQPPARINDSISNSENNRPQSTFSGSSAAQQSQSKKPPIISQQTSKDSSVLKSITPLKEQDQNKPMSLSMQDQMNQINQISNNLMKTLLHFPSPSSQSQQQQQSLGQSQQQQPLQPSQIKNTGNSSGFIKQVGGPIRATGDALQSSSMKQQQIIQGQQQSSQRRLGLYEDDSLNSSENNKFNNDSFSRINKQQQSSSQSQQPLQQQYSQQQQQLQKQQYLQSQTQQQQQPIQQQYSYLQCNQQQQINARGTSAPRNQSPVVVYKQNNQNYTCVESTGADSYLMLQPSKQQQQQQQQQQQWQQQNIKQQQDMQKAARRNSPSASQQTNNSFSSSSGSQQGYCYPNLLASNYQVEQIQQQMLGNNQSSKPKWKM